MKFEFNDNERNRIIELFDIATKSGGLTIARDALILAQKLGQPIDEKAPANNSKKAIAKK